MEILGINGETIYLVHSCNLRGCIQREMQKALDIIRTYVYYVRKSKNKFLCRTHTKDKFVEWIYFVCVFSLPKINDFDKFYFWEEMT